METKNLKMTASLAVEMLGKNETMDALINANFTAQELNLKITDRIKTFADALNYVGESKADFKARTKGLKKHKKALEKLEIITIALNEGKELKYDSVTRLYYPYFNVGGFSFSGCNYLTSLSCVGSRLCFVSADLATYAGKTFTDVYNDWING